MERKRHKVELIETEVSKMSQEDVKSCEEITYVIQRKVFDLNFFVKKMIDNYPDISKDSNIIECAEIAVLANEQIEQILSSINSSLKELRFNLSDIKECSK